MLTWTGSASFSDGAASARSASVPSARRVREASTSEINGVKVGNIAHMTAFSWSGQPIYSSSGGGAYLTNDRSLYEELTEHDRHLLRVLYDPRLKAGMPRAEALPLAARILARNRPE